MNTPEELAYRFIDAWNTNDAEALGALFAEDAEFVNVVGLWWHNRERIKQAHATAFESYFRESKGEVVRTKVLSLADDIAVVYWRWRMLGQENLDAGEADQRTGIFMFVARRTEDAWEIVAAQNTDVIPGAETIVAHGVERRGARYL